nr:hypothetical protein [Tanacetum cinerariifolium]
MGLWYLKGSSFDLTAFSDVDHAGCIDSRKSTSGGIQFLCDKLVSWMSKKQNCTANSSAKAKYVALSASSAQVITEYQLADMFTKALPEDRFKCLVRRIGMRCLTPAELETKSNNGGKKETQSSLPCDLAKRVKSIDGKMLGKDEEAYVRIEEATPNSTQDAKGYACDRDSAMFGEQLDMRAATVGEGINFDEIGFNQIQPDSQIDASLTNDLVTAEVDGSTANVPMDATVVKKISFQTLVKDEKVECYDCVLPKQVSGVVKYRYKNTIVGYFMGKDLAFLIVQNYVNNTWGKFGIQKLIRIDDGVFLFKCASRDCLEQVLQRGLWMIRKPPIILTKWSSKLYLKKAEVTSVLLWVKLHGVLILAYSKDGLSLIATQIGKHLLLDAFTSSIVEYEWKPPHCVKCKSFSHGPTTCPKRVKEDIPKALPMAANKPSSIEDQEEVNGHKKGSNKHNGNTYPKDDVNVIDLKNSFAKIMEEDKVLDECIKEGEVGSFVNVDGKDKEENNCNKVVTEEVKDKSDEDEVCMPDVMPGGGFLDGLKDDLDCYDAYEAQVYDLPKQVQAFCDQYYICLNSRGGGELELLAVVGVTVDVEASEFFFKR